MARVKQTAVKPRHRRARRVRADEVSREEGYESPDEPEISESGASSQEVSESGGEEAASSSEPEERNGSGGEEAAERSGSETSGSAQENFAADYQVPAKTADKPDPRKIRMLPADRALLKSSFKVFKEKHPFGNGWYVTVPPADAVMAWKDDIPNADNYFVCYEAVIEAGLRFPLHTGIRKILKGYDLGVWQLTPNSWGNILGYIAACEFQDIEPSFSAFAHMHYLSRAPGGHGAWYTLTTLPQYQITLDKVSKWAGWRERFYLISSPSLEHNRTLRRYNKEPALLGRKCALPELSTRARRQIIDPGFFETTTAHMDDGTEIIVPKNWIPHPDFFKDERFLSACGLSTMFPQGRSLYLKIFALLSIIISLMFF